MAQERGMQSKMSLEGLFAGLVISLLAVVTVGAGFRRWFPPLASEHGVGIDRMIYYLLITTGMLFLVGHLVLGYFIWRFSRQDRVTFRLASFKTEKKLALIPIALMAVIAEGGVLVLGLPVWGKLYGSAAPADAVKVEITTEQFGWNIRYPGPDGVFGRLDPKLMSVDSPLGLDRRDPAAKDDIVVLNELHLPVNRPALLRLRSKDVLHSFFLPNFRLKQDLVPGMTIGMWFTPTQSGRFEIACAELCGFGHYQMRGLLYVTSAGEFEAWLKEQAEYTR
jgi:cytochrome c oxidase subunit 2